LLFIAPLVAKPNLYKVLAPALLLPALPQTYNLPALGPEV
jgi:hypothetical protein